MPYVLTPYMLFASSSDSYQLDKLIGHSPKTAAEAEFADTFAAATVELLGTLPGPKSLKSSSVYSQACLNHAISGSSFFYRTRTSAGASERDALLAWSEGAAGGGRDVDACGTYNCGSGCG